VSATFTVCVGDFRDLCRRLSPKLPRGEVSVKVGVMEFGLSQNMVKRLIATALTAAISSPVKPNTTIQVTVSRQVFQCAALSLCYCLVCEPLKASFVAVRHVSAGFISVYRQLPAIAQPFNCNV